MQIRYNHCILVSIICYDTQRLVYPFIITIVPLIKDESRIVAKTTAQLKIDRHFLGTRDFHVFSKGMTE